MSAPTRNQLSHNAIRGYAERLGARHSIYDENGHAEISGLLDVLGGRTAMHEFGSGGDVHVEIRRPGNFLVRIGQTTSARRDRFAVAHGIGHYVLHYLHLGEDRYVEFAHTGDEQLEIEANTFAASLLMPAEHFTAAWTDLGGAIEKLSRRFDVSPLAVQARAEVLGSSPHTSPT